MVIEGLLSRILRFPIKGCNEPEDSLVNEKKKSTKV